MSEGTDNYQSSPDRIALSNDLVDEPDQSENKDANESVEKGGTSSHQTSSNTSNYNKKNKENKTIELYKYVAEVCEKADSPLMLIKICRDFQEYSGCAERLTTLVGRMTKYRSIIHTLRGIDLNSKVRQMFALSVPVNDGFLKKLRESATVEIDQKRRIIKYESNDGSYKIEGSHSKIPTKVDSEIVHHKEEDLNDKSDNTWNTTTGNNTLFKKRTVADYFSSRILVECKKKKLHDGIVTASDSEKGVLSFFEMEFKVIGDEDDALEHMIEGLTDSNAKSLEQQVQEKENEPSVDDVNTPEDVSEENSAEGDTSSAKTLMTELRKLYSFP